MEIKVTPPKTNIEPENHPFEKEHHLPNFHFGVPAVSFRGCTLNYKLIIYFISYIQTLRTNILEHLDELMKLLVPDTLALSSGNSSFGGLQKKWFPPPLRQTDLKKRLTIRHIFIYIYIYSRWWFQTIFIFTPTWGNDPI